MKIKNIALKDSVFPPAFPFLAACIINDKVFHAKQSTVCIKFHLFYGKAFLFVLRQKKVKSENNWPYFK